MISALNRLKEEDPHEFMTTSLGYTVSSRPAVIQEKPCLKDQSKQKPVPPEWRALFTATKAMLPMSHKHQKAPGVHLFHTTGKQGVGWEIILA